MREKYFNYKKEKNQIALINYFEDFLENNALKIFEKDKKYINEEQFDIIKYNINTIYKLFDLKRKKYDYYFKNKEKERPKSVEASKRFKNGFNIDDNAIKNEEPFKKLENNNDDIKKVFQEIYGI